MFAHILKFVIFAIFVIFIGAGTILVVLLNVSIPGVKEANSDEERILTIARYVAHTHDNAAPGSQYYGVYYSRRMPSLVRLPTGILETLVHASDCDSMVRSLIYLAAREGIEARQSDIFSGTFVHSVAEVSIDNRWVLVDPYLGVAFRHSDGKLANFVSIKMNKNDLIQEGLRADNKVADPAEYFYSNLHNSVFAQSGSEVDVPLKIGVSELPLTIGNIDASNDDVAAILIASAMGPIGSFLGPRFGSGKHTKIILMDKPPEASIEITFKLTKWFKTPRSVISIPIGACFPSLGALQCRIPADISTLVIRHGDWRSVFSVDQIFIKAVTD